MPLTDELQRKSGVWCDTEEQSPPIKAPTCDVEGEIASAKHVDIVGNHVFLQLGRLRFPQLELSHF